MPYEPEDEAGWSALPAATSEDEQDTATDSIGPLHTGIEPYTYSSNVFSAQLTLVAQPEKGLSFQIWPSALSLSRYAEVRCQEQATYWKGKRVIELGAGCGLVGLVFAALGAHILLTDLPNVLNLLEENIHLNEAATRATGGAAECCELTWGSTQPADLPQAWAQPDLVVAADVVYHRELFQPLLSTLQAFGDTTILLAHVRRWKSDASFFKQARKSFAITDITEQIDASAAHFSSHTQGAPRLFRLQASDKVVRQA